MIRALPKAKIDGKIYFVDERLNELRGVDDLADRISLDDIDPDYLEECISVKDIGGLQDDLCAKCEHTHGTIDCATCIINI